MVQQIIRDNIIIGRSEHKRSMLLVGNPGMLVRKEMAAFFRAERRAQLA
jgi:hypothetical protein